MKYTNYKNNKNNPLSLLKTKVNELDKDSIIDTNYESLRSAVNNGTLKPGRFYKITDYRTSHIIPNTTDLNDSFPGRKAKAYISFEDDAAVFGGTTVDLEIDGVSVASFEVGSGDPADDGYAGLVGLVDAINSAGIGYTASVVNTGGGGIGTFNEFTLKADNLGSEYEGVAELVWSATITTKSASIVGADPITIPVEPIIVEAVTSDALGPIAYSTLYPKDIIFYDIDSSKWGDLEAPTSKGFISRRIDTEKNIDVAQDFRGVVVRRWACDFSAYNGKESDYALWDTTVLTGIKGTPSTYPWVDRDEFTAISADDYRDYFMFQDYDNSINVKIGSVKESANIINATFFGQVVDTTIDHLNNSTLSKVDGGLTAGYIFDVIMTPVSYQDSSNQYIWGIASYLEEFLFSFIVGSLRIERGHTIINDSSFYYTTTTTVKSVLILHEGGECTGCHIQFYSNGGTGDQIYADFKNVRYLKVLSLDADKAGTDLRNANIIRDFSRDSFWRPYTTEWDFTGSPKHIQYLGHNGISNLETTFAASASMTFDQYGQESYAGIINLTGSGTVSIGTIGLNHYRTFLKVKLIPQSGLIIQIPQNDVENGFVNQTTITADGTAGEYLWIERMPNRQWRAYN